MMKQLAAIVLIFGAQIANANLPEKVFCSSTDGRLEVTLNPQTGKGNARFLDAYFTFELKQRVSGTGEIQETRDGSITHPKFENMMHSKGATSGTRENVYLNYPTFVPFPESLVEDEIIGAFHTVITNGTVWGGLYADGPIACSKSKKADSASYALKRNLYDYAQAGVEVVDEKIRSNHKKNHREE